MSRSAVVGVDRKRVAGWVFLGQAPKQLYLGLRKIAESSEMAVFRLFEGVSGGVQPSQG